MKWASTRPLLHFKAPPGEICFIPAINRSKTWWQNHTTRDSNSSKCPPSKYVHYRSRVVFSSPDIIIHRTKNRHWTSHQRTIIHCLRCRWCSGRPETPEEDQDHKKDSNNIINCAKYTGDTPGTPGEEFGIGDAGFGGWTSCKIATGNTQRPAETVPEKEDRGE